MILGYGGWRLLQRARRALREWIKSQPENTEWETFDVEAAYEEVSKRLPEHISDASRARASVMAVASREAVRADLAQDACGTRGEYTLSLQLENAGVPRDGYL